MSEEQNCRRGFDDFYHKIKAEVSYDHWCSIWRFISKRQTRGETVTWKPIGTAPKDNKHLLYLARFDEDGNLVELDFDGSWVYWEESWELSHINGYCWMGANGIEEPTHWAYQSEPLPTATQPQPQQQASYQVAEVSEDWREQFKEAVYDNLAAAGECPESDAWNCKYCQRANNCPATEARDDIRVQVEVARRNLSKAADNFEITRRVVFYNGITDTYMLTIEGLCSITPNGGKLDVTCKTGPGQYKKHFLGLSDNVTYFAEQLEGADVSVYHYRVVFKPQTILPNIDFRSSVTD